ncbi:MAG: TonB-dependent receptor plug domain-containing protein [Colwellia sp.]|nr:TonB-dependent receptor plug domain-containing protein [Colwellia sp.]
MRKFNCSLAIAMTLFTQSSQLYSQEVDDESLFYLSLEELLNIRVSVASNVIADVRKQPVSVTTITKDKIRLSGARTLSELLTIFVPGYFLVEDQDDTIAGFRGLVPDNNSKTMLLLNGVNLNTEWFWGAPDAILNGMDLEFIERIEVIRGPGSVTLGQGALLGVINIITKKSESTMVNVLWNQGKDGLNRYMFDVSYHSEATNAYAYFSTGSYDGQLVKNEGWAATRNEQGLTVYERQHGLKRGEYNNFFGNFRHKGFELDIYHFEQQRDLYNFYRDREVVSQTINGIAGHYSYTVNDDINFKFSARYTQDDYGLLSHGHNIQADSRLLYENSGSGFSSIINSELGSADRLVEPGLTMGGTREVRKGVKLLVNWDKLWPGNKLAFGMEYVEYEYGLNNSDGNNFIINEEIQQLGLASNGVGGFIVTSSVNSNNAWVKANVIEISSLFLEDFYSINDNIDIFAAFRFDDHPHWGSHVSPRIGGFYDIDNQHLFRLTWQTGFRGAVGVQFAGGFVQDGFLAQDNFPVLNDLAQSHADFDFDGIAANDTKRLKAVEPETIESLKLAYTLTQTNLKFNGVVFFNIIEDILTAEANGYEGLAFGDKIGTDEIGTWNGNWYYQNQSGQLKQFGYEIEIEYEMGDFILAASQAHVEVLSTDPDIIGTYVLEGEKNSAYPEDVSRFHIRYNKQNENGSWAVQYNHLYYWGYDSPTQISVKGNNIGNVGMSWSPSGVWASLSIDLIVKNVWNNDELYPINGTGNLFGADGTPALEKRTWWFGLGYKI